MPENTSSSSQKGRIFISYRRADSEGYAGRIYDRLALHFGNDAIFMDVDDIPAGVDFVKYLENEVQSCDVLIALIGKQWLNVKDEHGIRRLDDPNDFVRIEIATALKRDIRVIPVLLGGTQMPNVSDLPESLQSLTRRNGLLVYHHSFHADTTRLIKHLEGALGAVEKERQRIVKEKVDHEAAEKAAKEKTERETAEREKVAKEKEEVEKEIKRRLEKSIKKARRDLWWEKLKINIRYHFRMIYIYRVPILILLVTLAFVTPLLIRLSNLIPETIAAFNNDPTATNTVEIATTVVLSSTKTPEPSITSSVPTNTKAPTVTLTPTSLPTEITDAKGVSMVLVPVGEFIMGSDDGNNVSRPAHVVYIDSYYIDKYEVTNLSYEKCVNEGKCTAPTLKISASRSSYYENFEYYSYPVMYVSWNQAMTYCEWRNGDLPTEAQWEKAARGVDGRTYPWGEGLDCSKANFSPSGTTRSCVGDTTRVGRYEDGKSPYGVYDMIGNVWEWVKDWYDGNYYKFVGQNAINPLGPSFGDERVVRGGSWTTVDANPISRISYNPHFSTSGLGFRCVSDAIP